MLEKKYRLVEKKLKEVLRKWKPFFSYGIVLNSYKNKLTYNRFAIIIWSKSSINNVSRNYFRRIFYDKIKSLKRKKEENNQNYDFVFVIKKQISLNKKDKKSISDFDKDIDFLIKKSIVSSVII